MLVFTLFLAVLGPLSVYIGLVVFHNAFITFLLFHGLVCLGIPVVDLYFIKKQKMPDIIKALALIKSAKAIKTGILSGLFFFCVIMAFFILFRDRILDPSGIRVLLKSWNIRQNQVYVLLFVMIIANAVLEELYWRGYIYQRMRSHFRVSAAVGLCSVFYASYHYITTVKFFQFRWEHYLQDSYLLQVSFGASFVNGRDHSRHR